MDWVTNSLLLVRVWSDRFLIHSEILTGYSVHPSLVSQLEDGGISDIQRGGQKDANDPDERLVDPVLGDGS